MRYQKDHKEQTRLRIVQTAAERFREQGISAMGLKAVLSDAGLTNGAFYNHFHSKDDLARETITVSLASRTALLQAAIDNGGGVEAVIRNYFTPRHRDNPGTGCPSAALASEVARQPDQVREAFASGVERFIDLMASQWPELPESGSRARAMSIYSLMVGGMQLARATPDETVSAQILNNTLQTALGVARGMVGPVATP